jgi:hypothetical protein
MAVRIIDADDRRHAYKATGATLLKVEVHLRLRESQRARKAALLSSRHKYRSQQGSALPGEAININAGSP